MTPTPPGSRMTDEEFERRYSAVIGMAEKVSFLDAEARRAREAEAKWKATWESERDSNIAKDGLLGSVRRRIAALEKERDEARAWRAKLSGELQAERADFRALRAQLEEARRLASNFEGLHAKGMKDHDALRARCERLEGALRDARQSYVNLADECGAVGFEDEDMPAYMATRVAAWDAALHPEPKREPRAAPTASHLPTATNSSSSPREPGEGKETP